MRNEHSQEAAGGTFTSSILIPNCHTHSSGPGDGGGSPLKIWPGEQLLKGEREARICGFIMPGRVADRVWSGRAKCGFRTVGNQGETSSERRPSAIKSGLENSGRGDRIKPGVSFLTVSPTLSA